MLKKTALEKVSKQGVWGFFLFVYLFVFVFLIYTLHALHFLSKYIIRILYS